MGAKANKAEVRAAVREVLNLAPGKQFTREALARGVQRLLEPLGVAEEGLADGIEWNMAEHYVAREYDGEAELWTYFITKDGRAKERL